MFKFVLAIVAAITVIICRYILLAVGYTLGLKTANAMTKKLSNGKRASTLTLIGSTILGILVYLPFRYIAKKITFGPASTNA